MPEQIIRSSFSNASLSPGEQLNFDIVYDTANPKNESLNGLGLRVHFNANELRYVSISNILQNNTTTNPLTSGNIDPLLESATAFDAANKPNAQETNSYLSLNWSDNQNRFTGPGTQPIRIATVTFEVLPGFDGTSLNFEASPTAPGYTFDSTSLNVVPRSANQPPVLSNLISNQQGTEDQPFTLDVRGNFTDPEGQPLTFAASGLPSNLTINPNTGIISGTATVPGPFSVTVTATDNAQQSNSSIFGLTVTNVNDAPTVANPIVDRAAAIGQAYSFQFDANTFVDVDPGDTLTYSATRDNGSALPTWLSFNPNTRTFSGTPTANDVGTVNLRVTATDSAGATASDAFDINVGGTIEFYRFRNKGFSTGTYLFTGKEERDAILANPDFNQTFELEGNGNIAFRASTQPGNGLLPFYRLRSLDVPGTYLFAGPQEYNDIFAPTSNQNSKWVKEGLDAQGQDIAEFYLYGVGAGRGVGFNRFQNKQNNTFLFAGSQETNAILANPDFANAFTNQGGAFETFA